MVESLDLAWDRGSASVASTAAMLTDAAFQVGQRVVRPFASAPWPPDDPDLRAQPGHLRVLGGDFVALPFGSAAVPPDASSAWHRASGPRAKAGAPRPPHGRPADADWHLTRVDSASVRADLRMPSDDGVERLQRRIRGVPGRARIEFDLEVRARRAVRTSMGLPPIVALPEEGTARIEVDFAWGRVWPGRLHADARPLPDAVFTELDAVPARGGRVDLGVVPPPHPTEEVVQLVEARSPLRLRHTDGTVIVVEWDDDALRSLLLWISDRGIHDAPWGGRYRGLGVEPIASAFDLPLATSLSLNPLAAAGARTWIGLTPERPLRVQHAVEVLV